MRWLLDAQLPPSLAEWLGQHGFEARHVYELLPEGAKDETVWALAVKEQFVLVTKDEDLAGGAGVAAACAADRVAANRQHEARANPAPTGAIAGRSASETGNRGDLDRSPLS